MNISFPEKMAKEVEKVVASGNYSTKSEFFRDLFRFWKEKRALEGLRESRAGIANNKVKK